MDKLKGRASKQVYFKLTNYFLDTKILKRCSWTWAKQTQEKPKNVFLDRLCTSWKHCNTTNHHFVRYTCSTLDKDGSILNVRLKNLRQLNAYSLCWGFGPYHVDQNLRAMCLALAWREFPGQDWMKKKKKKKSNKSSLKCAFAVFG